MRRDLLLLGEMIQAAERAHQLTDGLTLEELQADQLRSESLLWNFTVLGEAAAQLSDDVKDRFANVPWQQPARLRNRIVHGYWSIDLEILHTTATEQLPAFAGDLRQVLDVLAAETEDERETQTRGTTPATPPTKKALRKPAPPSSPTRRDRQMRHSRPRPRAECRFCDRGTRGMAFLRQPPFTSARPVRLGFVLQDRALSSIVLDLGSLI